MLAPALITPPAILPVSLVETKAYLVVTHADDDLLLEGMIRAATDHLDGWSGILDRCLVEQTWRQDHDGFARELCLPLRPVISVASVTYRNPDGQVSTVPSVSYALRTDGGGRSSIRFDAAYAFPTDLHENAPVSVTYNAGYLTIPEVPAVEPGPGDPPDPPGSPAVPAQSTVPAAIKTAILLMVANWYSNREASAPADIGILPFGVDMLLSPYRRVGV